VDNWARGMQHAEETHLSSGGGRGDIRKGQGGAGSWGTGKSHSVRGGKTLENGLVKKHQRRAGRLGGGTNQRKGELHNRSNVLPNPKGIDPKRNKMGNRSAGGTPGQGSQHDGGGEIQGFRVQGESITTIRGGRKYRGYGKPQTTNYTIL